MSFLVPAALAFGIIIPIILLLYFMRPRRQDRVVGSTLLWQQALQDLQASRPWQRLRITPLLLLQLLAALVIVLILARPAIFLRSPISGDTIIILQASASMQATDVTPSRFEVAKSQVADLVDSLGPNDHLSLISMAHTPQVLIASSQDRGQIMVALQRARATNQGADLEQALSLAVSLAAGHTNVQVLVIGDGHVLSPDQTLVLPFPVSYFRIGTDAPNVALLALAARSLQGNLVALAQVANYSREQRSIPVELYADGSLVSVQTITLGAGASGALQWGPLPPTARFLHAHILSQDALGVDHEAWAIVGGSMHGRVLLVTKGNGFLQAALGLQPTIDLYKTTPDKYVVNAGNFDLTVFDGFVPATLPGGGVFFVNPPEGSYIFGKSGPEIRVSHIGASANGTSLLDNVDLSSIHVLRSSHLFTPALWAQPVISTPETPLLIAGENDNRRISALSFDLHDSDLPLQPSFPILINNMVNWFLPPPVAGDGQASPDLPVTVQAWPGADQVTITAPNQQAVTVAPPFPAAPFAQTNTIGIYQVVQQVHGQVKRGAFAVNLFDPQQSRLAPASRLPVAHSSDFSPGNNAVPRVLREIWPWIAALLLLILCLEWWLFSRSYRQQGSAAPDVSKSKAAYSSSSRPGRGVTRNTRDTRNTPRFIGDVQEQLEHSYRVARRRLAKITRRRKKGLYS
ncbi:MAG: VWA domain-containing protein [Chloroflexi bacterium]|nr:MAG: VWA domain-containing protein [Chloroflexota bacterium]